LPGAVELADNDVAGGNLFETGFFSNAEPTLFI